MTARGRVCRHCGQPIHYSRNYSRWVVTSDPSALCIPSSDTGAHKPIIKSMD